MGFKKWAAMVLAAAALSLAGPMISARAQTQNFSPKTPVILSPATGASVSDPVTVSFSLDNPGMDGPPGMASNGSGMPPGNQPGPPHHARQAYLMVDSTTPAAGDVIQADASHIAFPAGQQQISVTLAAGRHQLQVVFLNHEGKVSSHLLPSVPVTVTVQ